MSENLHNPVEPRESRFNAPWSTKGWYGQAARRRMDPEIRKIIEAAGGRGVNAITYSGESPASATTAAAHNPYINIGTASMFIWLGTFVFDKLQSAIWGALAAGGFFWLGGAFIVVMSIRQIPAWHRARRNVREYLRDHDGQFPLHLRWWT